MARSETRSSRKGLGPGFRNLFGAAVISDLGDGIALTAAPLLAVSLTDDPRLVAGLTVAQTLPWLLITLFSGAIVDRIDRRRVMWIVDAARAVVVGAIAVLAATDTATLPVLYVAFFALGIGETLFDNAGSAMLPEVVEADHLNRANGWLQSANTVCNALIGPPLGGLLFAAAVALPFGVDAVSFALSALLIVRIRYRPGSGAATTEEAAARLTLRQLWADVKEGVGYLRRHTLLRRLAGALGIWNLVANANGAVLVVLATRRLGLDEAGYGFLLLGFAAGGILGGISAERIITAIGEDASLHLALWVTGLTYFAVPAWPSVLTVGIVLAVEGFAGTVWNVVTLTLRQRIVPSRLLGRVMSAYRLVGVGTLPLGALLGGVLVRQFGPISTYWVAGVAITLLAIASYRIFPAHVLALKEPLHDEPR